MKTLRTILICGVCFTALLVPSSRTVLAQSGVAAAARANREKKGAERPVSEWYKATRVSLRMQEQGVAADTTYEMIANQDMRITLKTQEKGTLQTGEIMLINGQCQWMLAKNVPMEKGYEIDALDGTVLQLMLTLHLLEAASPGGPGGIQKTTAINIHEERRPIHVNTASAEAGLEAPWSLQGTIEPVTAEQWSFDLTVKHEEAMHFAGTWQKEASPPALSDDLPLDGWQILVLGPTKRTDAEGTIFDYTAEISKHHPKTLGELRKIKTK